MSEISSILSIALYRDAFSPNEPKGRRETAARDAPIPEGCSPSIPARCARSRRRHGGMPSMLLMPLMRSTPPFWMPARWSL